MCSMAVEADTAAATQLLQQMAIEPTAARVPPMEVDWTLRDDPDHFLNWPADDERNVDYLEGRDPMAAAERQPVEQPAEDVITTARHFWQPTEENQEWADDTQRFRDQALFGDRKILNKADTSMAAAALFTMTVCADKSW